MERLSLGTPYYYVDEALLIKNLELLRTIIDRTGCKILLAQKAFSMFALYPLIGSYLHGTSASGLFEARLGFENMGGETHVYSPAYTESDFETLVEICDHIVFNSFSQWSLFKEKALAGGKKYGIRINPEISTLKHAIYDPCSPYSRLGVTQENFRPEQLDGISGFHFHTLCEQNADALVTTLEAVEARFGKWLSGMEWMNIGGGHHITRKDYDVEVLIESITRIQNKYGIKLYIEPGEAVVLDTGFLVASVLEIVDNKKAIAILDTSAACHMPDVLEMPYTPNVVGAGQPGEKAYEYRLAGPTCLAGDIIGDYSFSTPLRRGDQLTFCDMAHYSMVKNNTFNGMPLPSILIKKSNGEFISVKQFGYSDFKDRLS